MSLDLFDYSNGIQEKAKWKFSDEELYGESGIACQPDVITVTAKTSEAACQTDKELTELTVLQRKKFMELKAKNSMLSKEIADFKCRKECNFIEEFKTQCKLPN